jgi:hypothetical protein
MFGTVGRGRRGRFHEKYSLRTFVEQVVCQIKFAKEGKFLDFELVGNGRKGEEEEIKWK